MAATVAPFRGRGEMPRPKVAMRRIKEVLRLKEGLGLSDTAHFRSLNGRIAKQHEGAAPGLVPELQRRGLTRTRYAHKHLKDTLREFWRGAERVERLSLWTPGALSERPPLL